MNGPDYRAMDGVSQTDLKRFGRSPAHFKFGETEETDAMRIGTMIHKAKLEPSLFREQLVIMPTSILDPDPKSKTVGQPVEFNRRKPSHREWEAKWIEAQRAAGKEPMSEDEFDRVMGMLTSLAYHPGCQRLFSECETEMIGTAEYNGFKIKGRADALTNHCIVDLKKTQDARKDKFQWSVLRHHYDLQAFWYSLIWPGRAFKFVVVEEKPYGQGKHAIGIYTATASVLESGERKALAWTTRLRECLERDEWPSYTGTDDEDLFVPDYGLKRMEDGELVV